MSNGGADRVGVLFVCLGNICRSPLAEGIFIDLARKQGSLERLDIDSCGTGSWHVGEPADHRSEAVARRHGISLIGTGRQFAGPAENDRFEWMIAMDRSNVKNLIRMGADPARIRLMRSFDPALQGRPEQELEVPDPYEWSGDGFERVFEMLERACGGLLESVLARR